MLSESDFATGQGHGPGQRSEERGFARAGGAYDSEPLAWFCGEGNVFERQRLAEADRDVRKGESEGRPFVTAR
jgi:hypothetical protein